MSKIQLTFVFFITWSSFIFCLGIYEAFGKGKLYQSQDPKYGTNKPYTTDQKIQQGTIEQKKYTTCLLVKRIKSRVSNKQACVYRGGNKTYELMYENNCPKQFKCVYNPWQKEPNIDDIVDSLNSIKK